MHHIKHFLFRQHNKGQIAPKYFAYFLYHFTNFSRFSAFAYKLHALMYTAHCGQHTAQEAFAQDVPLPRRSEKTAHCGVFSAWQNPRGMASHPSWVISQYHLSFEHYSALPPERFFRTSASTMEIGSFSVSARSSSNSFMPLALTSSHSCAKLPSTILLYCSSMN